MVVQTPAFSFLTHPFPHLIPHSFSSSSFPNLAAILNLKCVYLLHMASPSPNFLPIPTFNWLGFDLLAFMINNHLACPLPPTAVSSAGWMGGTSPGTRTGRDGTVQSGSSIKSGIIAINPKRSSFSFLSAKCQGTSHRWWSLTQRGKHACGREE